MSAALAFLHRQGIVVSDIAPNNLLVAFGAGDGPAVCFIDCDSMVFRGRQALDLGADRRLGHAGVVRRVARARAPPTPTSSAWWCCGCSRARTTRGRSSPHLRHVPVELRELLDRALGPRRREPPAAGEWQRALRGLLADGRLNERYPGPAPAPRMAPVVAPPADVGEPR